MKTDLYRAALLAVLLLSVPGASFSSDLEPAGADASPFGGPPGKLVAMPLWIIQTTDVPGFHRPSDLLARHLAHQADLERQGILFAAGPVQDPNGKHEYGLIIIRARDAAEAKRIADSDPMHKAGARTYTLHEWSLNEGHMTIGLDFSAAKASFQ